MTNEELKYYTNEFTKLLYGDKISEDNLDKDSQVPNIKIITEKNNMNMV